MKINSVDMDVMAVRRSQYPSDSLPEFLLIGKVMLERVVL